MPNILARLLGLYIIFALMDIEISFKKAAVCASLNVIPYSLPIILTGIFLGDPLLARLWVYRLFVVETPLSALIFYFIIKRVFNFSPTRSSIIVHNHILMEYLFDTAYLAINDIFTRLFSAEIAPNGFFFVDYLVVLLRLIFMLITLIALKNIFTKSRKYIVIPPNYSEKSVISSLVSTFVSVTIIYITIVIFRTYMFSEPVNPISFSSAFIYLFIFFDILLYLCYTAYRLRNRVLEWEMQATGTYISSLLHTNQEFRAIKHDFYNVLQGYGGYLAIKDYKGLEKYHNQLFSTTKQAGDFLSIIEVLRTRIAVYSILEAMSKKAKRVGVSFSINLVCDIMDIVLDDVDLCRVLSIVLDNAIEEAQISAGKQVNLSFERKDESTIVIVVSNTTKHDVDIKQILEDGFTTKENHTGIGLPQALHIINTYEHCSFRANYHDNQFSAFLILNAGKKN